MLKLIGTIRSNANHPQTKFTWHIDYTQFIVDPRINETLQTGAVGNRTYRVGKSVYLFLEFTIDTKTILNRAKRIVQKPRVCPKTLSQSNFASVFDISCHFKENVILIKRLSKLCNTAVAKMPHRYSAKGTNI